MLATPFAGVTAQDIESTTGTPVAPAETEPTEEATEVVDPEVEVPVEESETEVPVVEDEAPAETVETEVPAVDETNDPVQNPQQSDSSVQPLQTAQSGNITLNITSSDPAVADTLATSSTWSISTVSNGRERKIATPTRDLSLPMTLTSSWLKWVPVGEATITVDGGPQFEVWSQPYTVVAGNQNVDIVLNVLSDEQVSQGIFEFSIESSNPAILNNLPGATKLEVLNSDNEVVFFDLGLPRVEMPFSVFAPAAMGETLPYGVYTAVVTPPSGFHADSFQFTLGQPSQSETITLRPIVAYSGNVTVLNNNGRTLADAQVTVNGVTETTDASGVANFTNLENGDYQIEVSAADGRSKTGTLSINDADGTATVTLDAIVVDLVVTVVACGTIPSTVVAGETAEITYTVTNNGTANMLNSRARIYRLDGRTYTYDQDNQIPSPLAPGASATVTMDYRLGQADIDAGYLRANASVQSTSLLFGNARSYSASLSDCVIDQPATYDGTVAVVEADDSPVPDATVTLDGDIPAATTGANGIATFADLEEGSYPVSVQAADGRTATGTLDVTSTNASVTIALPAIVTSLVLGEVCPELPAQLRIGDEVTFRFTVTNNGNVDITNMRGSVYQNETGIRIDSDPAIPDTLAPGENAEIVVVYTIGQRDVNSGGISGVAQAAGDRPSGTRIVARQSTLNCSFVPVEDFTVTATAPVAPDDIAVGDEITIPVVITNTGDTTVVNPTVTNDRDDRSLRVLSIANGGERTYNYTTTVTLEDMLAGSIDVEFSVVSGRPKTNPPVVRTAQASVALPEVVTSLTLGEVCPDFEGQQRIGDEVTFRFTVTNTGNVDITNMRGSVYQNETGTRIDSDPAIPGTLAPGESAEVVVVYTIGQRDVNRGGIDGTAQAAGDRPNGTRIVASQRTLGCEITPVEDFSVVATAPDVVDDIAVGDEITIPVVITNTGETTIVNPTVTNDRDDASQRVLSIGNGGERTYNYTTVITEADMESGVLNIEFSVTPGSPKTDPPVVRTAQASVVLWEAPEMAAVSIDVSSADESIANSLPEGASWTVTQGDDVIETGDFAGDSSDLPTTFALSSQVEFGNYELSIDAGPTFEPLVAHPLVVNESVQAFSVELTPVQESNVTVNLVSVDPEIANTLPDDASWTVSFEGQEIASDEFAADHLELPAVIVVEDTVPFGTYTISIDAGPTFEPLNDVQLVVNQQTQSFTVELAPVVEEEETHTGTIRVVEADTITPVVGAEVSLFGGDDDDSALITVIGVQSAGGGSNWGTPLATGSTDASGEYAFTGLPDGVYGVAVVAEDGRTATGTLTINGSDNTSLIVMQPVPDPTDPTDPVTPAPEDGDADDATPITKLPDTGTGTGAGASMAMLIASIGAAFTAGGGLVLRKNRH